MTARLYTLGLAALLATTAGCDLVYNLERPPDAPLVDAPLPYDRCGPFLYDEPLRYALIANPNVDELGAKSWSWSAARAACLQRGMDLAVFNDEHELGSAADDAIWPYWMGASRSGTAWRTVDECPSMMPAGGVADSCGIVRGPNAIAETACSGEMPKIEPDDPAVVMAALCETPRPESGSCLGNDPAKTTYVLSPTVLTFAAARTFCSDRGGHPVVFETHAEWLAIGRRVEEEWHRRFWVGSTFDGTTWKTDNKCPAHYAWASGAPSAPHADDCMGSVMLEVTDGDGSHMIVTGVDRMACSTAEMFALCEI